ncbi:hypothetical protein AC579_4722 [Pseudocercospora musae]|uniref:Uncharacterized protein n=1 Tax=Pseudocercospora musae TaxID=113226 RepID=A0A139IQ60_9PEZI|nr:hypothetical protein AC579_4722 [Pseudocercospora musae]
MNCRREIPRPQLHNQHLPARQAVNEMRRINLSWLRWVLIAVVAAALIFAATKASPPRLHNRSGQALRSFSGSANTSHLFRRAARCDWSTAGRDTPNPNQCQTYVRNGKAIWCMMYAHHGVKPSDFDDFDALEDNGWTETHDQLASASELRTQTTGLELAFQQLGISSNYDKWVDLEQSHSKNVPAGSSDATATIVRTDAKYKSLVNLDDGAIVGLFNFGPNWMNDNRKPAPLPVSKLPKLRQWSDVHGLCLQDYAIVEKEEPEKLKEIKHGFRYAVSGQNMEDAISMVLEVDEPSQVRMWPGRIFTRDYPDRNKFYALLGASNIRGFGWLLAQHKQEFGFKIIKAIHIFNCPAITGDSGTFDQYCIYMQIGET